MKGSDVKIVKARQIIDGTCASPLLDHVVLIEDGRIQAVAPWREGEFVGELFDLGELTLLPGFIDTHLHLTFDPGNPDGYYDPEQDPAEIRRRAAANAQAALCAGVTTVGDCGAHNEIIFPLRRAIADEAIIGPRVVASGNPIMPIGGHGADHIGCTADGIDEIRAAVQAQDRAGADFIKVMATGGGGEDPGESHYDLAELIALREEATRHNLSVAAHAHGSQGIRDCVAAGIQRIEHCTFYDGESGFGFDPEVAQTVADHGVIVSPTNVIDYRRIEQGGQGAPRAELNHIWRGLLAHGVSFAASSDAGVTDIFYDDYVLIPELMVAELGMLPIEAIVACTRTAAKALGLQDEIGTIEAGKIADLVAVDGDPLKTIGAMRQVHTVIRSGKVLHQRGGVND